MRTVIGQDVIRRKDQTLSDVHGHVANDVIWELLERWKSGTNVSPDTHVETVKLTHKGEVVGFRMYLVSGEPKRLGKLREEELHENGESDASQSS